ncbi:hypothetical protein MMC07_000567 [Pseudocyphellaria aurata]|nr:hypothetical protein [Pseudocyphellaria aurata]
MAYDLQATIYNLQPATSEPTPTLPTSQTLLSRDNEDNNAIRQAKGTGTDVTRHDERSNNYLLSIRAAESATRWPALADTGTHATTAPIDVPANASSDSLAFAANLPIHDSHYHQRSPLQEFLQNRRTSITFNPRVTLDSGNYHRLEDPLPRLAIETRQRRRSILQELPKHTPRSLLSRSFSDPDRLNCSSFATNQLSAPIEEDRPDSNPDSKHGSPENHHCYSLSQSAEYDLGIAKEPKDLEQGVSLTSASTASLLRSEIQTPLNGSMDCLVSPISSFSPFHHPVFLDESNSWPTLPRQGSAPRVKSYSLNRKDTGRQGSRRSSRRSTGTSMSPATAFLNKFAREEAVVEPDAEGQLVGEYVLGTTIGFGGFSVVKKAFTIEGDERICRAVKIVRKRVQEKGDMENEHFQAEFEREIGLWRCLAHRHVLSLISVHVTNFATFCFTGYSSGGTLSELVHKNRDGIGAELTRRYSFQLASAIRYLHEDMRIAHRDIKLENCLIDYSEPSSVPGGGNILLCDFGFAEFVVEENSGGSPDPYANTAERPASRSLGGSENGTSFTGSLQYASPELIRGQTGSLRRVVDVWAFGVVVYALMVGRLPFRHSFEPRVPTMILAGEWSREALVQAARASGRENEMMELMNGCLDMDASSRWKISDVLYSRWLNGCEAMLEEITQRWKL